MPVERYVGTTLGLQVSNVAQVFSGVCVCMYVCLYMYMCMCVYVCISTFACVSMCGDGMKKEYTYMYIYIYICVCVCVLNGLRYALSAEIPHTGAGDVPDTSRSHRSRIPEGIIGFHPIHEARGLQWISLVAGVWQTRLSDL